MALWLDPDLPLALKLSALRSPQVPRVSYKAKGQSQSWCLSLNLPIYSVKIMKQYNVR